MMMDARVEALIALGVRTIHGSGEDAYPAEGEPTPSEAEIAAKMEELARPTKADFEDAIEAHIDATAAERGYANSTRLASYVASTTQAWKAEAEAFVEWRDDVWVYVFAELDKVMSGKRDEPTVEAFIAELPKIKWPKA
jgi:hypothetical protein